ncbi:MAG TPA: response regulator [Hanamia sp.]
MQKCILVYDDDEELLIATRIILEKENYRVETRSRCDDIINEVSSIKPDLVFMDLLIPVMGGERALKLMKQNDATRHVPVIIFSVHDSIEKVTENLNANGYLKKPFTIAELLQIVDNTISEKK